MIKYIIPTIIISIILFAAVYSIMGENHIRYTNHTNTISNNLYFSSITQTLLEIHI